VIKIKGIIKKNQQQKANNIIGSLRLYGGLGIG
jgi:hypothetical protein